MANKYLKNNGGVLTEEEATQTSSGAGDAGKIPALDSAGRINSTMMPVGIGADTASIVSSENLAAGDMVDIYDNAGTPNTRKADGASAGKYATGFVLAAVTSGDNATVYFEGQNNQLTGLTAGARMYLSATTPGEIVATAPTGSGQVVQYVGRAINATTIAFEPAQPIVLA
jgi:hypothetical protein